MCGIVGIVNRDATKPPDVALLRAMTDRLRHRGPDAAGTFIAAGIGLGSRRLSIIDLESGDQPIASENGSIVVVCNGEIYNYIELRAELTAQGHAFRTQSDTEVIVHLYEEHEFRFVERLRGMFAIALWDASRRRLLLARDRLGIKPLYYAETAGGLYFASEQKAILEAGEVPRELSPRAVSDLLSLGFVATPATMFRDIRQLSPGTWLEYKGGAATVRAYWDVRFPARGEPAPLVSERVWVEALRDKLAEIVRLHLRSDVEVGAWLSGGLDSSAIVSLMLCQLGRPVHAVSLAFESSKMDEIRTQRTLLDFPEYDLISRVLVCSAKDFARLPEALWFAEDPSLSGIEVIRLLTAEASARDVKVVMTGEGADEVFGGYPWFKLDKLLRPLARLPWPLKRLMLLGPLLSRRFPRVSSMLLADPEMNTGRYRMTAGWGRDGEPRRLLANDLASRVADPKQSSWELALPEGFAGWHPFSQLQYFELKVRLPSFINHTLDRGSMARSLEARVPFLDHELVEFAARIPPALKLKGMREKHVLREAAADFLPREIASRRKHGLRAPTAAWLRGPLPEFASELLSEPALRRKGYFDPRVVRRFLAEHRSGRTTWTSELFTVLCLQLWDEIFLRGLRP
jgi:asparagine synthase (glutamine-hydrolysing)